MWFYFCFFIVTISLGKLQLLIIDFDICHIKALMGSSLQFIISLIPKKYRIKLMILMFRSFSPFRIQQNQKYFRQARKFDIAYVMRCMMDKQIYKMDRKSHRYYFIWLGNMTLIRQVWLYVITLYVLHNLCYRLKMQW